MATDALERASFAALGAIPGTVLSHPFDLIKVRCQNGGLSSLQVTRHMLQSESSNRVRELTQGLSANIRQKMVTRGTMFAAQSASETLVRATPLARFDENVLVAFASSVSGFTTGFLAALAELRKVQRIVLFANQQPSSTMLRDASGQHQPHSLRVMSWAGTRNAVYDATFFTCVQCLTRDHGFSSSTSFGLASTAAVILDYPIDRACKQLMAGSLSYSNSRSLWRTVLHPFHQGFRLGLQRTFAGIGAKCIEFGVSYSITGLVRDLYTR